MELPFDPRRGYHATWAEGRVYLKGAPETLLPRCRSLRVRGGIAPLDGAAQDRLHALIRRLAERGMRLLLVAEGETPPGRDPDELVVLGLLGIGDVARTTAAHAIAGFHEAGIRVIMVTGDHPMTARAVASDIGLEPGPGGLISGPEIDELDLDELGRRLERTRVIARATPLDKLRIVQALQRRGHAVAMTGDGANDGPALRAADVGIAIGQGTEVARQAADLVLIEADFAVLLDAMVEGRSYWRNVRRSAGLLLGGNLGEILSLAGPIVAVGTPPLSTRQMLGVNLITDVLPALVIATQPPEHRRLHQLAREGERAVEQRLRVEILRRALSVAIPTMGAYILARGMQGGLVPSGVAFSTLVTSQLAHTLDSAWVEGTVNWPVVSAVLGSGALLALAAIFPRVGILMEMTRPRAIDTGLIAGATVVSVVLNRMLRRLEFFRPAPPALPTPHHV
jgi:magnesium-transporting ATPase (P-type)